MGLKPSILLQDSDIAEIRAETGFSSNQISRLYSRFTSLDKRAIGTLCRDDLLRIPELAINPLGERIVDAFFMEGKGEDQECNFKHFLRTLAHFRPYSMNTENPLNDRENKLKFAFSMYDLDGDGFINKDDLLAILHMMVGENISDEQLGCIANRAISDADLDTDGLISFEEFKKVMEKTDMNLKMSIRFLA